MFVMLLNYLNSIKYKVKTIGPTPIKSYAVIMNSHANDNTMLPTYSQIVWERFNRLNQNYFY